MYEQVFQFNGRPFTTTPFVKHYFAGKAIHQSLGQARLCIDRASGPVLVIGGIGTGKSLFLAMLEEQYKAQFLVVNLGCARLESRKDLLQSILFAMERPVVGLTEAELRFDLMAQVKPNNGCPNGMLLLVDDAETLTLDLIDELRLITNYVHQGQPRIRLVMAGKTILEELLNHPQAASFSQRIASRCYLQPLDREQTGSYVWDHINRVGGDGASLFPVDTIAKLFEYTDGVPRLINQVCDFALILAGTRGASTVSEDCIAEAWADVQSLPGLLPPEMAEQNEDCDSGSWTVIEFGELDDSSEAHDSIASATELQAESFATAPVDEASQPDVVDFEQVETGETWSQQVDAEGDVPMLPPSDPVVVETPSDSQKDDLGIDLAALTASSNPIVPEAAVESTDSESLQSDLASELAAVFGGSFESDESIPPSVTYPNSTDVKPMTSMPDQAYASESEEDPADRVATPIDTANQDWTSQTSEPVESIFSPEQSNEFRASNGSDDEEIFAPVQPFLGQPATVSETGADDQDTDAIADGSDQIESEFPEFATDAVERWKSELQPASVENRDDSNELPEQLPPSVENHDANEQPGLGVPQTSEFLANELPSTDAPIEQGSAPIWQQPAVDDDQAETPIDVAEEASTIASASDEVASHSEPSFEMPEPVEQIQPEFVLPTFGWQSQTDAEGVESHQDDGGFSDHELQQPSDAPLLYETQSNEDADEVLASGSWQTVATSDSNDDSLPNVASQAELGAWHEPELNHEEAFESDALPAAAEAIGEVDQQAETAADDPSDIDRGQDIGGFADPFAETFEQEETLRDRFTPVIAAQNRSSLQITSADLAHVQPNDDWVETDEAPASAEVSEESVAAWDANESEHPAAGNGTEPSGEVVEDLPVVMESTDPDRTTVESESQPEGAGQPEPIEAVQWETTEPVVPAVIRPASMGLDTLRFPSDLVLYAKADDLPESDAFRKPNADHVSEVVSPPAAEQMPTVLPTETPVAGPELDLPGHVGDASGMSEAAELDTGKSALEALQRFRAQNAAKAQAESESSPVANDPTQTYHEHAPAPSDDEISRQADAILKRLEAARSVSHGTPVNTDLEKKSDASKMMPTSSLTNDSIETLDPTADILHEIRDQQSMVDRLQPAHSNSEDDSQAASAVGEHERMPPSLPLEQPLRTQPGDGLGQHRDDSEMIVVNRMNEQEPTPKKQRESIPFPETPVSTGRAERMDYQKLFDQLRNVSPEE